MSDNKDLTKLALFFGRIPETHIKALKGYAFIFFNGHTADPKLDYSVETTDKTKPTVFKYEFQLDLEKNDHIDKRYKALERAIRDLFWSDAKVEIKVNGQEVFKSE